MNFRPCSSCACHVKSTDARCPFCGAVNAPRAVHSARASHVSRAQWLAFGSIAFVGCVGSVADTPHDGDGAGAGHDAGASRVARDSGSPQAVGPEAAAPEAAPPEDAGVAQDAVSPDDAGSVLGDSSVACQSRTGYFDCAANVCDRSIQACYQGQCLWYGALPVNPIPDAATCGPCPTCECLKGSIYPDCHCQEDGEGTISISCAGCYGSPPVRLERLA
jgi:hypothetical protein